jgi:tetratricopeptide (TPR) repeat protein
MLREHPLYLQAQLHHRTLDNHVQAATLLLQLRDQLREQRHPRGRVLGRALEREVVRWWPLLPALSQESMAPRLPDSLRRQLPRESQEPPWSFAPGHAPCLLYDQQHQLGFVRTFCVTSTPSDTAPALQSRFERTLGPQMRESIQQAGELAFSALQKRFGFVGESSLLAEACYLMNGRESQDWQHEGGSIGFSAVLALASDWLNLTVPVDLACTGAWDGQGRPREITALVAKMEVVVRELPWVRRLALPSSMMTPQVKAQAEQLGLELCGVKSVEGLLDIAFSSQFTEHTPQVFNLAVAVQNAERDLLRGVARRESLQRFQQLERLCKDEEEEPYLARCLWWQASCHKQLGESELAFEVGRRASELFERLFDEHRCVPEVYFRFLISQGLLHQLRFEYEEASRLLKQSLDGLRMFRRDRQEIARAHGALGQQWLFQGRFEEGWEHLQKAAEWTKPEERPRNLNNQADLLMRWGREKGEDAKLYRQAQERLEQSREQWRSVLPLLGEGERLQHEWFLRLYEGKLACYSGALPESLEELQRWREQWETKRSSSLTLGLVDKWWGLALLRQGYAEEAESWLQRALRVFTPQKSQGQSFLATVRCSLELERALIEWRGGRQEACAASLQRAFVCLVAYPQMRNACPEAIAILEERMEPSALRLWSLRLHY